MPQPKQRVKKSVIEHEINPLSDTDMADNVAGLYHAAALRKHKVLAVQIANGHDSDDAVPGADPKVADDGVTYVIEDGSLVYPTYAEQMADVGAQMTRLRESFDDIWPAIEKLLEQHKQKGTESS